MDSITHALYKAIAADNAHQNNEEFRSWSPGKPAAETAGLRPLATRKHVWDAYAGAAGTDLHIALTRGDELLALQLEFIAAGFCPPAGMYIDGAEVIISPGRVELMASTDDGKASWTASLMKRRSLGGQIDIRGPKAFWEELVS
jgi:hypothetical protein